MNTWAAILLLLAIALIAAFGWHVLGLDPGDVRIHVGSLSIETTLVFAVVALLLGWGTLSLFARALRWPGAVWRRRASRRGRERFADGYLALVEGRTSAAVRDLEKAGHVRQLLAPALLARAQAEHAVANSVTATATLDAADTVAPAAALALRAKFLLADGKSAEAFALLKKAQTTQSLSPAATRYLIDAALAEHEDGVALEMLGALARFQNTPDAAFAALQARTLASVLEHAPNHELLGTRWAGLSRTERRLEAALIAYAKRGAALGTPLGGMGELEASLRREWSEVLVRTYGELGPAEVNSRLRQAEAWLAAQPNSPALLLTLSRLCNQAQLWGRARDYANRALAIDPNDAAAWESLGSATVGLNDMATAQNAFHNAVLAARHEPVEWLDTQRAGLNTNASVFEERSEHGVPRLVLPAR